jgi:hypothetical protein
MVGAFLFFTVGLLGGELLLFGSSGNDFGEVNLFEFLNVQHG